MLNILYLNNVYNGGGAEKITRQLYAMGDGKLRTHMIVGYGEKQGLPRGIQAIYDYGFMRYAGIAWGVLHNNAPGKSRRFRKIVGKYIEDNHIDIVHINNAHGNYIGIEDVAWLAGRCKVVWTLHDMWAVTGHCAQAFECDGWKVLDVIGQQGSGSGCGKCKRKRTYPAYYYNNLKKILSTKEKSYTGHDVTFVTPSGWLEGVCRKSILSGERIITIHNGIDLETFDLRDRAFLRNKYEIPPDKRVLLFAAASVDNEYKGFGYLLRMLESLKDKEQYCLVVVGAGLDRGMIAGGYNLKEMGYVRDEAVMNEIYSLADVYLITSMADTYPTTVMEALASGTPVAGFATGGITEQVGDCGWLVESGDCEGLAERIREAFEQGLVGEAIKSKCRRRAEELFSIGDMLSEYKKLYNELAAPGKM